MLCAVLCALYLVLDCDDLVFVSLFQIASCEFGGLSARYSTLLDARYLGRACFRSFVVKD